MSLIAQVYALLLRGYPRKFQAEFAKEMQRSLLKPQRPQRGKEPGRWPVSASTKSRTGRKAC